MKQLPALLRGEYAQGLFLMGAGRSHVHLYRTHSSRQEWRQRNGKVHPVNFLKIKHPVPTHDLQHDKNENVNKHN